MINNNEDKQKVRELLEDIALITKVMGGMKGESA